MTFGEHYFKYTKIPAKEKADKPFNDLSALVPLLGLEPRTP